MGVSKMAPRSEPELCGISVSMSRAEFSKAMSSIGPGVHERAKGNRFWGNTGENVKRVSGNNVREVRDYSNAVPGISSIVQGRIIRGSGMRKSRGRVRT